jgi:sRNA-binding protein
MHLQGLVAGAARIDLDGNPAGEVTARDAEHAAARLAGIMASREARRVAAGKPKLEPRVPCVGKTSDVSFTDVSVDEPPAGDEAESTGTKLAEPAAPAAAKVLPLEERPVLRLPAFRQKCG